MLGRHDVNMALKHLNNTLKEHWKEYFIEAAGLGIFMIAACSFGVLFFHPASPLSKLNPSFRLILMGLAMGGTATGFIMSPWGKRSGAHINPAVTLTFWWLGKIKDRDAFFYVLSQFIGGTLGVLLSWIVLGHLLVDKAVNYVVTIPGNYGIAAAFVSEFFISFVLMTVVLVMTNSKKLELLTPYFVGVLLAIYIALEAPLSGMSMNPARTFGSAVMAGVWTGWWIYFVAPPLAMLTAGGLYVYFKGRKGVKCAKLHHNNKQRCIFCEKPVERCV